MPLLDLTGDIYGRLTVLYLVHPGPRNPMRSWRCRCACGRETTVIQQALRAGQTVSCGCLRNEKAGARLRTHGRSRTPEYSSWCQMIDRCDNPACKAYPRYGGRGIRICDRWRHDFSAFYADMGPRPSPQHSIDRLDGTRGYEPLNCRWATAREQRENQLRNRPLTHNGESLLISQWARRLRIRSHTIWKRLQLGWTVAQALSPDVRQERFLTLRDRTQSFAAWCRELGMGPKTLEHRLEAGWSVERALTTPVAARRWSRLSGTSPATSR
jgi:hypothetical protein